MGVSGSFPELFYTTPTSNMLQVEHQIMDFGGIGLGSTLAVTTDVMVDCDARCNDKSHATHASKTNLKTKDRKNAWHVLAFKPIEDSRLLKGEE